MSSGKKGKKTKGKSLSLGEFLGATSTSGTSQVVLSPKTSWADECEEFEEDRSGAPERIVLPTAPRQASAPLIDPDRVPSYPPFIAYVANLPFEVEDEDIERFFNKLKILNIRLPREGGENGRFKGFGYVEFETKHDLLEAISLNDDMMKNRKIRVDIAEEDGSNKKPQSNRDDEREDRSGGVSDWRAAPRDVPQRDDRSYRNGAYNDRSPGRGYNDRHDDRFGDRGHSDRSYGRDRYDNRGYSNRNERDNYDRGYDHDRGSDRGKGYDRDYNRGGSRFGSGGGKYDDRRNDDHRYDDKRGGYRRDDYDRRGGEDDRWRRGGTGGGRDRDEGKEPQRERPKLNLKPRSRTTDEHEDGAVSANPSIFGAAKPVDTASKDFEIEKKYKMEKEQLPSAQAPKKESVAAKDIFGAAKPVDTAARERQIEEKLMKKQQDSEPKKDQDTPTDGKWSIKSDRKEGTTTVDSTRDGHISSKEFDCSTKRQQLNEKEKEKESYIDRDISHGERKPFHRDREPSHRERETFHQERENTYKEKDSSYKEREVSHRESDFVHSEEDNAEREKEPLHRERDLPVREKEQHDEDDSGTSLNGEDIKERPSKISDVKKPRKGKKAKDENVVIDTANKFSQLGLDEEEA